MEDIEIEKVLGISDKIANILHKKYKVYTVDQLKNNKKAQSILTDQSLLCMEHCYLNKFTRSTIDISYKLFIKDLHKLNHTVDPSILVGSYRRNKPASNDVDILFIGNINNMIYPNNIIWLVNGDERKSLLYPVNINKLKDQNVMPANSHNYQGLRIIKSKKYLNIKMDLFNTTLKSLPFALMHYTGSYTENIIMRQAAIRKGLKLNQYGLFDKKTGDLVDINAESEEDIYKYLGKEYREPKDRR